MPQVVAVPIAGLLFSLGAPLAIVNTVAGVGIAGSIFGAAVSIGLAFGASFLANALFSQEVPASASNPTDVQQSLRASAADRQVFYGQYQASGNWVFAETKQGSFHKLLSICQGPLVQLLSVKIDDNTVTRNGSGIVTSSPYNSKARVELRYGTGSETYYTNLASAFSEWTSSHKGLGVVSLYATQFPVGQSSYYDTFPNGINTLYRVEGKFTKVTNISTGATEWSDNAAGVIKHFMESENGMRIPSEVLDTTLASAAWLKAWNRCDDDIDLKAGGTEKRYRLWGAYKLSETPGSVLDAMLKNCDARPILTRDGGMSIAIGEYNEPTVLLDNTVITGFSKLRRGNNVADVANKLTGKWLSKDQDYQLTDIDAWIDATSVAARGEIPEDYPLVWTPSHSQARRLLKIQYYRLNPLWSITVTCRLKAMEAFQEQFVAVDYTVGNTRIQGAFETDNFEFNIGDNGILKSVTLTLRSMSAVAYTWDEDQEEGDAPVVDEAVVDNTIPAVSGFDVTVDNRVVGGVTVPYPVLDFDDPGDALVTELRGKKTADTNWTSITVPDGATSVDGFIMDDGVEYEFQARNITLTGRQGAWSTSITVTATADETPPGDPTSVSAVDSVGSADLGWTTPNSANFSRVHIYRNTTDNFSTATEIGSSPFYGSPSTAYTHTDGSLSAGTYYYYFTAANFSGVESDPPVESGSVTVT